MTPKEYLGQIYNLDQEIKTLQNEYEISVDTVLSSSKLKQIVSDAGQTSNPTGDLVMKRYEYATDLLKKTNELIHLKIQISTEIDLLLDRKHRVILKERYLNSNSWKLIAFNLSYDLSHVHRLHREALEEFCTIFPEKFKQ